MDNKLGEKWAHLKVTNTGGLGRRTVVELNGEDISRQCTSVVINSHCKNLATATITFLVSELELEGDFLLEAANG